MRLEGDIKVPGDKSITHRALIINAVSIGDAKIYNYLNSEDILTTIKVLKSLGVDITIKNNYITIKGKGFEGLKAPKTFLDCQNSGTTARLLIGLLSGLDFTSVIVGDKSLSKRPMRRLTKHLNTLNGRILLTNEDYLPAKILPSKIKANEVFLDISSAQIKSAVMLAALKSDKETIIHQKSQSRNHTEILLNYLGCDIETVGLMIKISGKKPLSAKDVFVPGDLSSASFFIIAALIIPNSKIIIRDCLLNPTRLGIIQVLKQIGANIEIFNKKANALELSGDILVQYTKDLQPFTIDKELVPLLIDEIPILTLLATQINGTSIIKDAKELRVKETDRISTLYKNLTILGAKVSELDDGLVIQGKTPLKPGVVNTYHDHRLSMMLKVAKLLVNDLIIENDDCDRISYPNFENDLNKLLN